MVSAELWFRCYKGCIMDRAVLRLFQSVWSIRAPGNSMHERKTDITLGQSYSKYCAKQSRQMRERRCRKWHQIGQRGYWGRIKQKLIFFPAHTSAGRTLSFAACQWSHQRRIDLFYITFITFGLLVYSAAVQGRDDSIINATPDVYTRAFIR